MEMLRFLQRWPWALRLKISTLASSVYSLLPDVLWIVSMQFCESHLCLDAHFRQEVVFLFVCFFACILVPSSSMCDVFTFNMLTEACGV